MEFYLKAIMFATGVKTKGGHDITKLIENLCSEGVMDDFGVNGFKGLIKKISENSDSYSEWESGARYDPSFTVNLEDLEKCLIICEELDYQAREILERAIEKENEKY